MTGRPCGALPAQGSSTVPALSPLLCDLSSTWTHDTTKTGCGWWRTLDSVVVSDRRGRQFWPGICAQAYLLVPVSFSGVAHATKFRVANLAALILGFLSQILYLVNRSFSVFTPLKLFPFLQASIWKVADWMMPSEVQLLVGRSSCSTVSESP